MASTQEYSGSVDTAKERSSVSQSIILIGGGLHAGVVFDLIEVINTLQPRYVVDGFYDDDPTNSKLSISYLGTIEQLIQRRIISAAVTRSLFVTCIGDNVTRERIVKRISESVPDEAKLEWVTLIHPFSSVSRSAFIFQGTVVCAGAVIGPNTKVGIHTIINTNASVDHDCDVGDYVHIAPGVHLCGAVSVGNLTLIGVGCQIIPKICVGQKTIIGAGTTVLTNVADMTKVVGIVKSAKKTNMVINHERLSWLPKKLVNFSRIEHLLTESINRNHFANFGPCVHQLEIGLRNIFEINPSKAIILTCNGSAALHAVIGGLEIYHKKKLKFATQAFTFPTSVQGTLVDSTIVDVDSDGGIDLAQIDTDSIDGIVVTNAFGHVVDIKKYTEWASNAGKYLVFDNAATSFTFYQGQNSLNFGNSAIVSFHHTKPVGFGEGGAIIIDEKYEAAVRQCINFGYDVPKGDVRWHPEGSNYKMSDVQAAFIYAYLDGFEDIVKAHKSLYKNLTQQVPLLNIGIRIFPNFSSTTPFASCFPIFFKQPIDENLVKLTAHENSIDIRKYYKPLVPNRVSAPSSHHLYDHIVCFPCHYQMTNEHTDKVVNMVQELHQKSLMSS